MGAGVLPFQRACDVSDAELGGLKRAIRVAQAPHGTHVSWLIGRALPYALWESDSVSALSVIIAEAPFSKLAVSESLSIRVPQGAFFRYSTFSDRSAGRPRSREYLMQPSTSSMAHMIVALSIKFSTFYGFRGFRVQIANRYTTRPAEAHRRGAISGASSCGEVRCNVSCSLRNVLPIHPFMEPPSTLERCSAVASICSRACAC